MTNGLSFSGVPGKGDNVARYTEIFGNFEISVPFDFAPRISEIFS